MPYSAYRETGISWLGAVPQHWHLLPGRGCYREKHVANVGMVENTVLSLSYGHVVVKPEEKLHGLVPASFESYQIIDPGDIVVRPTDLQNDWNSLRFALSANRGIITSAYIALNTKGDLGSDFGYLLLHAYDLKKVFYGLGSGLRQNLDWRDFKYLPCLVPPPAEQTAIVRYLDHVDRRVRRFVHRKKRLIRLLEEQRRALVEKTVTGQQDVASGRPYAAYRESGGEWLPAAPAHWDVRPFSRCAIERADYRGATPAKTESGVFLCTAKNIRRGVIDYEASKEYVSPAEYQAIMRRGLPRLGDLLLTTEAPLGNAALVDREDIAIAQRVIRFRFDPAEFSPDYVLYSVLSPYFQNQLQCRGTGSTAVGIKASKLPQLRMFVPPRAEQTAIASYLVDQCSRLERLAARTHQEIEQLNEYRARLVADVVLGRLDAGPAAAELPAEALDDAPSLEEDVDALDEIGEDASCAFEEVGA